MAAFVATARLLSHELFFKLRLLIGSWFGPPRVRAICKQIRKQGFAIIEGYVPPQLLSELRSNCDAMIERYGMRDDGAYWVVKKPGALRLRHLNERSPLLDLFSRDLFCRLMNLLFVGSFAPPTVQYSVTHDGTATYPAIPGKVEGTFGDSYHFDQWFHQLKTVVPLRDVGPENGPLTVLPGSAGLHFDFLNVYHTKLFHRERPDQQTDGADYDDYVPDKYKPSLQARYGEHRVTAKAGDLIVFDTRLIHFADHLRTGERHLLWFYF